MLNGNMRKFGKNVMYMVDSLLKKIEAIPMNFWQAVLLIYGASFLRGILEGYINLDNGDHFMGIGDTFFHYPLWYAGVFLFLFILVRLLTHEKIETISKVGSIFSFVILLAPLVDLLIGKPVRYLFIVGNPGDLLHSGVTFLGSFLSAVPVESIGLRIEIAVALLFVGCYVFYKTHTLGRSVVGIGAAYATIFVFLSLPTLVFYLYNGTIGAHEALTHRAVSDFYYNQDIANSITSQRSFIVAVSGVAPSAVDSLENQYSITTSLMFLVLDIVALAWWLYLFSKEEFFLLVKNLRLLRLGYYFSLFFLGVSEGVAVLQRLPTGSLFDCLSLVVAACALAFGWFFSVWENDEVDVSADKISNKNRPLVQGKASLSVWRNVKYVFLLLSLVSAFLAGWYLFILTLLFIFIYHLYSAPPLRLKRFLGLSSVLIALNAVVALMMGFFIASGTENLARFPSGVAAFVFVVIALVENVKNIKDIEGDGHCGIYTLPVVLGEKKAKTVIGTLIFLAAVATPFVFLLNAITLATALTFGTIFFVIITRPRFDERYFFVAYLAFFLVFAVEVFFIAHA